MCTPRIITNTYNYDANGNRGGGTVDEQDRLLTWAGNSYAYSAVGWAEVRSPTQPSAYLKKVHPHFQAVFSQKQQNNAKRLKNVKITEKRRK